VENIPAEQDLEDAVAVHVVEGLTNYEMKEI